MAGSRPGVMLYFETLQAVEELEAEDAKQIMSAILRYSRDGEAPAFRGTLAALWSLIQSSLDRDGTRYGEKQMRGLWLTYCRKCKSIGEDPLGFDEWASIQQDNDTLHYVERTVDGSVNGTSPSTSPTATASPSPSSTSIIEDTDVSSCAEPETGSTPPVIGLPLNDGTEYGVTEEQCREWADLYPAVDVLQQLRNMRGWLLSNKERRKTKRGISRFITGWLSKEQDRGRSGHSDGERRETHGAVSGTGANPGQPAKKWGVPTVEL